MKITCQSCQAKYTIADEKVAGKTVKIKCKKCGATIVVNGSETGAVGPVAGPGPAAAAPGGGDEDEEGGATRVFAEGSGPGGSEWTVNVTDEDQRTLTSTQLVIEYQRGVVNADTYVWKDGMADWSPVSNVPELMTLINSVGSAAPAPAPLPAAGMPAAAHAHAHLPEPAGGLGGTMMMNDGPAPSPLAAAAPAAMPTPVATPAPAAARRKAPAGGVDLFAPGQQPDGGGSAASTATTSADRQVGERNENSVLFSISALTAAAGVKRGDDPFDLGPAPAARNGGRNTGGASVDDIMNLGGGMSQGPMLAPPPLLAPVIEAPPPPAPVIAMQPMNMGGGMGMQEYPQKKKAPIGLIVGLVVGVLGLGGGAFFALSGGGGGDKKTDGESANTAATAATTAPVATTAAPATTPAPADTGNAAQPPTTGSPATTTAPTQGPVAAGNPGKPDPKPGPGGKAADPKPDTKPDTKPDPKPDPKPDDKKPDDKKPDPGGGGKEFDRAAASSALGGAAGGAKGCKTADGPTGSGRVKVTFAASGNVTSVTLESGPFQGTPLAGCIISAFRGAHVPPFDGSPVSVGKSFNIN